MEDEVCIFRTDTVLTVKSAAGRHNVVIINFLIYPIHSLLICCSHSVKPIGLMMIDHIDIH